MWILPGTGNVIENGFANMDFLFSNAPAIFLFLIPAITMKSFAEEKRTGTLEILLTKPLSEFKIVFAKYLAGVILVIIALIPTIVYYYSIASLSSFEGPNGTIISTIDKGGTLGSYIGLILLGSGFVAIGIFASSLTSNQIISFLLAIFMCFFFYLGFDLIANYSSFGGIGNFIQNLGINEHYESIQRGVIDSRDILYFVSLIGIFILGTQLVLQSRKWS